MKISRFRIFLFAALLAVFCAPTRAEDCACNPLEQVFKAQVLMAENERYTAMTKADVSALDKLLTNELVYSHSTGNTQSKSALLDDLKTGKMRYRKITPLAPIVRFYGDIAIVNGAGDFEVTLDGRDQDARLVFTAVYVLKGDTTDRRWQLTSWHSSTVPTT